MDSLTTDPVAAVLTRLFQEAAIADRPLLERFGNKEVAQDEITKLLEAEAKDYRAVYRTYVDNVLNVSPVFGRFLYICVPAPVRPSGSLAIGAACSAGGFVARTVPTSRGSI